MMRWFLLFPVCLFVALGTGCVPGDRLHFPEEPTHTQGFETWYDTNRDDTPDFALTHNDEGQLESLSYDDDQDGQPDRLFHLEDYDRDEVPHLIVLIDSIPYDALMRSLAQRPSSVWGAFHRPVKVIAPYPSMSAVCFSDILHAPPMPGAINKHYDPRPQHNGVNNLINKRLGGYRNPWQQRLHYNIDYSDNSSAWLKPRPWLKVEFERARQAFDASPDRTTIVYIATASAMLMKHGQAGLDESLDELERFLLQIMYERKGAVQISVMSDHGHNLAKTTWIDVEKLLEDTGFRVTDQNKRPDDVFVEMDGLMTWFGVHTSQPEAVSEALLANLPEVETIAFMDGPDILVRNPGGTARITMDNRRLTYAPQNGDPLDYGDELSNVSLSRDEWFERTADHLFPDAPARLWDAFHGQTRNSPQVMVTLRDGYCAGIEWFTWVIDPLSTHGGLNQVNSAAFLMTTKRPLEGPLRAAETMDAIQPGWVPPIVSPSKE
ncbi:MAG: hypothetical protein AAGA25_10865 [Planctomycetota bacterium]